MYTSLCTEADLIQAAFSGWLHIKMDVTVMPSIIIIDIYSIISMVIYTVSGFPLPLQCYVSVGVTWKPELWCSSVECSINILMLHCACVCVRERERERERERKRERERERERERDPKELKCFHDNICRGWQIPNKQSTCQELPGHHIYKVTASVMVDCV